MGLIELLCIGQSSYAQTCASNGGGVVLVPAMGSFIQLQIDGDLLASPDKAFVFAYYWLGIFRVSNLAIHDQGRSVKCGTPRSQHCKDIRNIKSFNSKSWHFELNGRNNIVFDHVTVIAPPNNPITNGGIHISISSIGVTIQNWLIIATGDHDCISIGPGSHNINITNVHCSSGHGSALAVSKSIQKKQTSIRSK
ncbi:exopolygalacturonase-like [Cucumis melo var. makuwa]|uniref:Exopolygalacturonase-like n=1 Tax=Cucumis melo var. makuwa TaxID=1194695 RepID=A0A5D3BBN4_CUCMM|nr:exopolygalacturonase-like [Cucumis melo var. makuwa]TYJ96537.1 exopolygalacturonase-like [Cucumis melo var. makuwa]